MHHTLLLKWRCLTLPQILLSVFLITLRESTKNTIKKTNYSVIVYIYICVCNEEEYLRRQKVSTYRNRRVPTETVGEYLQKQASTYRDSRWVPTEQASTYGDSRWVPTETVGELGAWVPVGEY